MPHVRNNAGGQYGYFDEAAWVAVRVKLLTRLGFTTNQLVKNWVQAGGTAAIRAERALMVGGFRWRDNTTDPEADLDI